MHKTMVEKLLKRVTFWVKRENDYLFCSFKNLPV